MDGKEKIYTVFFNQNRKTMNFSTCKMHRRRIDVYLTSNPMKTNIFYNLLLVVDFFFSLKRIINNIELINLKFFYEKN